MAVSPKALRRAGCTPKEWRKLFTAVPDKKDTRIKKLELLVMNRIMDGRLQNMREYQTYAAIDMAYDVAFDQTTPTLIRNLIDGLDVTKVQTQEMQAKLEHWGLSMDDLFLKSQLPDGSFGLYVNHQTF